MDLNDYIKGNHDIAKGFLDSVEEAGGEIVFVKLYKGDADSLAYLVANLSMFFAVKHFEEEMPVGDDEDVRFGMLHLDLVSDDGAQDEVFLYPGQFMAVSRTPDPEKEGDYKFSFALFDGKAGDKLIELCTEREAKLLLDELFGEHECECDECGMCQEKEE